MPAIPEIMKYTPKIIEEQENVNVSHSSPLGELLLLLGGLIGIVILAYVVLGFAVDVVVKRLPPGLEQHFGVFVSGALRQHAPTEADAYLQEIVNNFVPMTPLKGGVYRVIIIPSSESNAMALPGGYILVLSGLLKEIDSENALAFILAHELGHFAHRDHLRGLGRGLVLSAISAFLMGADSGVTEFLVKSLMTVEMKFSQRQETQADLFALELLHKHYGHIGGATDFFNQLAEKERLGRLTYFFATHPYPKDRVDELRRTIREKGYLEGSKTALDLRIEALPDTTEARTFKDIF